MPPPHPHCVAARASQEATRSGDEGPRSTPYRLAQGRQCRRVGGRRAPMPPCTPSPMRHGASLRHLARQNASRGLLALPGPPAPATAPRVADSSCRRASSCRQHASARPRAGAPPRRASRPQSRLDLHGLGEMPRRRPPSEQHGFADRALWRR
jgi:hypothetical protein